MSKHGVFVYEEGTAIAAPVNSASAIQVVVGTAPVNMVDDPSAVVNKPIYAGSAQEAMAALGYSEDLQKYTLCQTMYATNNIYQVSPVVYINVLDPDVHKAAVAEAEYAVSNMQAKVDVLGMLRKGLVVKKDTTALVDGADYSTEFDEEGNLIINLIEGGAGADATVLKVSGNKIDPAAVTASNIIGATNPSTGKETGMEVIRKVYPTFGVAPSILLAPGWSHIPEVGIALSAKAANINGVFKAIAVLDLDTAQARKYTDCKTVKENSGFTSEYCYPVWPCVKVGEHTLALSAIASALMAYTDIINEDVPSQSPSNKRLGITGTCLADGTEVVLDQDQGSTVNTYGVATAINMNGWRMWGNYTGAFPGSSDPKNIWVSVRRMFNWQGNNFIQIYFEKVDNPMNKILIESIVDSENIRCSAYAPRHWAGASIRYVEEDNPITDILAGKITFRQAIAPYTPAQEIDNILSYDTSLLQSVLLGGE